MTNIDENAAPGVKGNKSRAQEGTVNHLPAALAYGKAGLKIFPILESTKDQPLIKQWGVRASSDPTQITEWWTRWPQANIGLACMASGIGVVDSDVPNGEETLQCFAALEGKVLSPTKKARSPRGGIHRFYRGRVATTVGKIGENVDTRGVGSGNGGYVLLAPSRTPNGAYSWIDRAPMAEIDAWVVEACGESVDNGGPAPQEPLVEWDQDINVDWAKHYLTHDAPVSREGAGGDDLIVKRVVPILKDHAISEEMAGELMAEFWNSRCEPPWQLGDCDDKDNLYVKIHNSYLYCRNRQPGVDTAEVAFGNDVEPPETDAEIAARLKRTAERRKRREQEAAPETLESLLAGWCYIGQQRRWVRKRDGRLWESTAFNDYFADVSVPDKRDTTLIGRHLLSRSRGHAHAVQKFDTFCYLPGKPENVGGAYNQYVPSLILPVAGDTALWDEHLKYLFPVNAIRDMVLDWLAWVLQHLDKKPKHALFIRGEIQGTGKSFIGDVFAELIGEANRSPVDQGDYETPHNGWQMKVKLITCEEIRSLAPAAMRKLHGWITQGRLKINEKNMPQLTIPDVIAYMFFSNKLDALPVDDSDRRYLVVATDATPKDKAYYCRLYDLLDDPAALAAIKHQLMTRNVGDYTAAGAAPYTDAKDEMIEESATDLQSYMVSQRGQPPFSYSLATLTEIVDAIPKEYRPRNGKLLSPVKDVLRRRYSGIALPNPIQTGERKSEQNRVWAIGPQAMETAKLSWSDLSAVYRAEHNREKEHAAADAADDFAGG